MKQFFSENTKIGTIKYDTNVLELVNFLSESLGTKSEFPTDSIEWKRLLMDIIRQSK